MKFLQTGHFLGETNQTVSLGGITLTDTVLETQENIDWHYHENAYFTLILQGRLIEGNKHNLYNCSTGTLLYHGSKEPHFNVKIEDNTKFFNVEFDVGCFKDFDFGLDILEGIFSIDSPDIKFLLYKIFRETKVCDDVTLPSIQMLLCAIFGHLRFIKQTEQKTKPFWAKQLKEILRDNYAQKLSLRGLSDKLGIHPVHLSRDFPKHFQCTFGDYVRKLRVEYSLSLLPDKSLS